MKPLVIIFLMCSLSLYSQKPETKTILDNEYSVNYKKENNEFEICKKTDNFLECYKYIIENKDEFSFMQALDSVTKLAIHTFKYKFFDKEYKLEELSSIDYSKITISNTEEEFNNLKDNGMELKLEDAPVSLPTFKITKTDSTSYEMTINEKSIKFTSVKDIASKTDEFKADILKALKDSIDKTTTTIETSFKDLLGDLYNTSIAKTEDYVYLATETLSDSSNPPVKGNYNFYYLLKDKNIHVKVCKVEDKESCKVYGPYELSISENEFVNSITNQHKVFQDGNKDNQTAIGKVYYMIVAKKETKKIDIVKKEINDSISNIFEKIENAKNTFSGQFVINKKVPLYKNKLLKKRWYWLDKYSKPKIHDDIELIVDSVNIRFFNNRADNITIVGRLSNDKDNTRVFTNRNYSLPLREFTHRVQTNSLVDKNNDTLTYYYDDILDYLPYKKYNYAVKNGEIKVRVGDSIKAVERKIGDYFTGIFFSDFLGLNSNNSNSLIVAEGRIRIPWHLRNYRKATLFDNITAYASVNLFSGFENSSRKIELDDTFDADETSEANAQNFTTDNFNLLSNNNIDAGVLVTPYTFEWKGASTFIHLRYGLRFIRTGVEYNLKEQNTIVVDSVPTIQETIVERKGFQVFSIGQEAELNFEIRPQSSVGADVTVGLNWFRATGTNKNDVDFSTTNNSPNLKVMTNIYALTNSEDSNSGVYFRLGGHYNLGTYKVFPQIMVGYATNLSSFVNKLKKED
ncbi:hypothetical protein [Meridianimaribacter sp. CL38]|uniref:hypothetical protein n=1 Tax=Meridianimaribacter sp. CL38 TaxID=2213021 RepID=UPI00103B60A3|nr:hypothetical protein [Meridianimaribacter sp. CL38]